MITINRRPIKLQICDIVRAFSMQFLIWDVSFSGIWSTSNEGDSGVCISSINLPVRHWQCSWVQTLLCCALWSLPWMVLPTWSKQDWYCEYVEILLNEFISSVKLSATDNESLEAPRMNQRSQWLGFFRSCKLICLKAWESRGFS